MTYDEVQHLIDRYLSAESTADEERRLEEFFSRTAEIPPEWRAVAVMLRGSAARLGQRLPQSVEPLPETADFPSRTMMPQSETAPYSARTAVLRRVAAAAAVAVLALLPAWWLICRETHGGEITLAAQDSLKLPGTPAVQPAAQPQTTAETAGKPVPAPPEPARAEATATVTAQTAPPDAPQAEADMPTPATPAETAAATPDNDEGVSEEMRRLVEKELQENLFHRRLVEEILANMQNHTPKTFTI